MLNQRPGGGMPPEDTRNLILFLVLSVLLFAVFNQFAPKPPPPQPGSQQKEAQNGQPGGETPQIAAQGEKTSPAPEAPRYSFENEQVQGSFSSRGLRIDTLNLKNYHRTVKREKTVHLLGRMDEAHPYFASFGWTAAEGDVKVPGPKTQWRLKEGSPERLTPGNSMVFVWDNGEGQVFETEMRLDRDFMFSALPRVTNNSERSISLHNYGLIARIGVPPDLAARFILHEGAIGYAEESLTELKYKELQKMKQGKKTLTANQGWIGFTDKYWFTGLIPPQGSPHTYRYVTARSDHAAGVRYQTDVLGPRTRVAAGEIHEAAPMNLFSGAKKLKLLEKYEKETGAPHIDLAVDFGMFYFLTKPFFLLLNAINSFTGHFGIAILIFTVLLRLALFPLANKAFKSFAKMREMAPKMMEMREKYGDDKEKLQKALMELYSREKANPFAGCLPILVQIPIFFALYKTLYVTIEMRHEPFFGWIQDLSAPDPTSIFTLFGLIPVDLPGFLQIGIWPVLMGFTLWMQKHLNPPPQDPMQAKILGFMPIFITFILASFPAGVVIYWTWNNILSMLQQYIIMKRMGVEVHIFKTGKQDKELQEMVEQGPAVHPAAEYLEHEAEEVLEHDEFKDESRDGDKPGEDDNQDGEDEKPGPKSRKNPAAKKKRK